MFFNCYCLSSPIASKVGWGGYMSIGNATDFREDLDLLGWWISFAVVGGVVALVWWLKCQHLWRANQRGGRRPNENQMIRLEQVRADMTWLQK